MHGDEAVLLARLQSCPVWSGPNRVATALALTITYPQAGNIGGGGFMLIHRDGDVHMLDYRERAPIRADSALYRAKELGRDRVAQVVARGPAEPADVVAELLRAVEAHAAGEPFQDDVTILCVRRR